MRYHVEPQPRQVQNSRPCGQDKAPGGGISPRFLAPPRVPHAFLASSMGVQSRTTIADEILWVSKRPQGSKGLPDSGNGTTGSLQPERQSKGLETSMSAWGLQHRIEVTNGSKGVPLALPSHCMPLAGAWATSGAAQDCKYHVPFCAHLPPCMPPSMSIHMHMSCLCSLMSGCS